MRIKKFFTVIFAFALALIITLSQTQITIAQNTGGTWFPPQNLSKSGGVKNPTLIVSPDGIFYSIWEDEFAGFVYSFGDGLTWSEPQAVEFPFSPDETPLYKFAIDSRDRIHAIWINEEEDLYYSRSNLFYFDDRLGWGYSQNLARSTISFEISIDENSNIHLAYLRGESDRDGIPAGIYYQQFIDGTTDWSDPITIEQSPYLRTVNPDEANIDIATTIGNELVTVYITWDNPPKRQIYLAQSDDTGISWNEPIAIGKPPDAFNTPNNINIGAYGDQAMIYWNLSENGDSCFQQFIWTSDNGLTWQNPQILFDKQYGCPEESHLFGTEDGFLLLAIFNEQAFFQFWNGAEWSLPQQQNEFNNLSDPETNIFLGLHALQVNLVEGSLYVIGMDSFNTSDIWSTGSNIPASQSWFPSPSSWIEPDEIAQEYFEVGSTHLVADSSGQIHAFWNQSTSDDTYPVIEIYYSVWDGTSWSPAGRIIRSPSNKAYLHSVAISSDDVIYLIWESGNSQGLTLSWVKSNSAYNLSDWVNSDLLPSPHLYATSPEICIDENNSIFITYVLPLNENRGVYSIQFSEGQNTWEETIQVVDAVSEEWAMVDNPHFSSCNQEMEIIWTTYSLPPESIPLALYVASTKDFGETWSAAEEIIESNINWSDAQKDADNSSHRIWEANERGISFLWHQYSSNKDNRWNSPENILTTNDSINAITTLIDPSKQLHLFFATTNSSERTVIHHWTWNGDYWDVNESLSVGIATPIIADSLSVAITSEGVLGAIFGTSRLDTTSDDMIFDINFSSREIELPEIIQSDITATPTSESMQTPEPEIPTSTLQPILSSTPTPQQSVESGIMPQTNAWSGLIAGAVIGLGILILILSVVLYVRFREVRKK